MDKAAIARHFGVEVEQIVSVRPEPTDNALLRVLVDYGIGGIKVLHVNPAEALSPEPAKALSPPAEASSPVVVVSDKPAAKKTGVGTKSKR